MKLKWSIPILLAALGVCLAQTTQPTVRIDPAAAGQKKTAAADPLAAAFKARTATEEQITVITSERLFYDYKQKFALFQTNVVVVDPRIKITAEQMTVFFDESNRVSAIKCENNVHISQEDKTAKADLATYDVHTGDIVLTGGRPEVVSGRNVMTGDPIIFNRDNNTVTVPGTLQKPRIVIVPDKGGSAMDMLGPDGKQKKEKTGGTQSQP